MQTAYVAFAEPTPEPQPEEPKETESLQYAESDSSDEEIPPAFEAAVNEKDFWEGKQDSEKWKQLNDLFVLNQQHTLVPAPIQSEPDEQETIVEKEEVFALTSAAFERNSAVRSIPMTVRIVIECVKTKAIERLVWNWAYKDWPICVWLEFEFCDGRVEVVETRLGDNSVYIGVPRYIAEETQFVDLCKENFVDAYSCLGLYNACVSAREEMINLRYDIICEYINGIPRYGKKLSEMWTRYVRKGNRDYLTSHQLIFLLLSRQFDNFGSNRLSAFYSISDFFEYIMDLKQSLSPVDAEWAEEKEDEADPYAASSSSSSSSSSTYNRLTREEV